MIAVCLAAAVFAQDFESTKQAADEGDADAQYRLGLMYTEGRDVGKNDAEAVEWFILAAQQENVKAQYRLGQMYAKGQGVARNDVEAMLWFRKAAQHGNEDAKAALAAVEKTNTTRVHDVDYLKKGMKASVARRLVLKDHWIPNRSRHARKTPMLSIEKPFIKKGFVEIEVCAVDRPVCVLKYRKKQVCLEVGIEGEEGEPDSMRVTGWTHACEPDN